MARTGLPSRATNSWRMPGLARIASSARFCLPGSGWNSASSVNSTPSSSTICCRSLVVATPYWTSPMRAPSDVDPEVDHVAIAHHVLLALEAQFACLLGALLAAVRDEVVVGGDLGADEAALEIGVDHPGSLRRGRAGADRPGANLLGTGGEIRLLTPQPLRAAEHPTQAPPLPSQVLQEKLLLPLPPRRVPPLPP